MNTAIRIGLVGYGQMGKAIAQIAASKGHEVVFRWTSADWQGILPRYPAHPDVVIDFTAPDRAADRLIHLAELGVPVVSGTTGWLDRLPEVQDAFRHHGLSGIYGSNFSIGVNLMFLLNRQLAHWMNRFAEYDPFVEERHHVRKKDAPGGTALRLAHDLLHALDRKTSLALPGTLNARPPLPSELSIAATRAGAIAGDHSVVYTSAVDELRIEHRAHTREGFASGAVWAAEYLVQHPGIGFIAFEELFAELTQPA